MGIKERQERERETIRRAILDAARDLFVAEGFGRVSIRKIAERIEYSPAAIYGYFPSKDDIFFALAEEGFHLLHETASATPDVDDPLESIRRRMWSLYTFSVEHPEHFALMFLDRTVPTIGARYQHFTFLAEIKRDMANRFQRCVEAGVFPAGTDPRSAFRVMVAALVGAVGARLCNRLAATENAEALARDVIELCIAGLRAGAPLTFVAQGFDCPELTDSVAAEPLSDYGETTGTASSIDHVARSASPRHS